MFKKIIGIAAAASFLMTGVASAATFSNVEFQNGQTTVEGLGGATVSAKFRVVVSSSEVVEQIQTDVIGDGLAPVCTSVGGELGLQQGTHDVSIPVKLPPNTGTHNLDVQGSGIFGAFRADDCVGDVVGTAPFAGALRVVGSASVTPAPVGTTPVLSDWDKLMQSINALIALITLQNATPAPAPAPVTPTACASFTSAQNGGVVSLQGFLVSKGYMTQAQMNTGPGIYGPKTTAAANGYKSANGCF